jgi:hypothetical protein
VPRWPITASPVGAVTCGVSGSALFSFLSSTMEASAASRARSRCWAQLITSARMARVRVGLGREFAGAGAQEQESADGRVDVGFGDQAAFEGFGEAVDGGLRVGVVVGVAVHAGLERGGVGFGVGGEELFAFDEVGGGLGVGADGEVRVPGVQGLVDQRVDVVGDAVGEVVAGHHAGDDARLDRAAEGFEFVFVQRALGDVDVDDVAVGLGVVGEEVLEDRGGAPDGGVVAAQAGAVGGGDACRGVRVLAVALFVAAPAGVAQGVDDRCPDVEGDHRGLLGLPAQLKGVGGVLVEGADLGGDRLADAAYEVRVPGGAEADGLREDGGLADPGDAVQGLAAGVELRQAQPVYGRLVLVKEGELLRDGQLGQQRRGLVFGCGCEAFGCRGHGGNTLTRRSEAMGRTGQDGGRMGNGNRGLIEALRKSQRVPVRVNPWDAAWPGERSRDLLSVQINWGVRDEVGGRWRVVGRGRGAGSA